MDGGVQMRCLFGDALQQIRHVVGAVEFRSQCDDIATLADAEVIPLVEFGVYLERGFRFLTERGFVPKAVALLLYGRVAQTLQIVCDSDLFCFLDVHDILFLRI